MIVLWYFFYISSKLIFWWYFFLYPEGDNGPQGPPGDAGESISSADGWKFKVSFHLGYNPIKDMEMVGNLGITYISDTIL